MEQALDIVVVVDNIATTQWLTVLNLPPVQHGIRLQFLQLLIHVRLFCMLQTTLCIPRRPA